MEFNIPALKAAAYHFRENKNPVGGVAIVTGSITSFLPAHEGVYVYAAAKYGVPLTVVVNLIEGPWPSKDDANGVPKIRVTHQPYCSLSYR